ncbi:MAG: ornithine cyclodeaminase family protein [Candidatus Omnitrophica bacterium]|nr:ornithine cyclodeaminase family protein [Candidatus Omnitrophota bacterium]
MTAATLSAQTKSRTHRRTTLILTQADIARLIGIPTAIRLVRQAFKTQALGQATMPPKLYLPLPRGDFRAMPAYLAQPACCGMKWVNVHPANPARGLPTIMAIIVLNDPATGVPLAVMDGLLITKLRTAAAAAVAARALARPNSRVVGLVGCGGQADAQVLALAELFHLDEVRVWGRIPGEAARFCVRLRRQLRVRWSPVAGIKACVAEADLIVTITPSRRPLVMRQWVKPGAHINAIGADAPGKQELDAAILREALVVVDDRRQAIHGGEINVPVTKKQFSPKQIHATVGDILIGRKSGRTSAKQITVFDSTGLATHDISLAHAAYRLALKSHLGKPVHLFRPPLDIH